MHESKTVEFKLELSPSFLKTVSAFANEGGGTIYFGIDDAGVIKGVSDPTQMRLNIENTINDSIDPRPTFSLTTEHFDDLPVVVLKIKEGEHCPYLYQGKAYGRSDTASVPLDSTSLRKLVKRGTPETFEGEPSSLQDLSFSTLQHAFQEALGIETWDLTILKTLGLYMNNAFDNTAALLSDNNPFPGIELVKYSQNGMDIFERATLDTMSVLTQLDEALAWHERYYAVEQIRGLYRTRIELVPQGAFREAVANALVHRNWLIRGRITVSMYEDRIVVVSPGGLPEGVDEYQYLEGDLSVPRNENLAYVLLRLGIIERLGSGVRRIRNAYKSTNATPVFSVSDSAIRVTLPTISEITNNLDKNDQTILSLIDQGFSSREDIEKKLETSRSTTTRLLTALIDKGLVERVGQGRATTYRRKA